MIYLLALPMTFLGALGAFFFKRAAMKADGILPLFTNKELYLGGMFYVSGAILNILLLQYLFHPLPDDGDYLYLDSNDLPSLTRRKNVKASASGDCDDLCRGGVPDKMMRRFRSDENTSISGYVAVVKNLGRPAGEPRYLVRGNSTQ